MKCWKTEYTKKEAQTFLNNHNGYSLRGDRKLKMYKCPNGDHYHITKSEW